MSWYWVSTTSMTIGVETGRDGRIVTTPPIARKFLGHAMSDLLRWMGGQKGLRWVRM